MGGVCSKADTKKRTEKKAAGNESDKAKTAAVSQVPQRRPADNNTDPHCSIHEPSEFQGERGDGPLAPDGSFDANARSFTFSTAPNGSKGEAGSRVLGTSPGSPNKLVDTKPETTTENAACPSPSQKGDNYDKWFPPEHDAEMKLGEHKYDGVGVQSPSTDETCSAELHSVASTPSYCIPPSAACNPAPLPSSPSSQQRRYDPMLFVDEDSAAPETASSAFLTPRELRDGSSVTSVADNMSLVSHGSMASAQPHGYYYYNSNTAGQGRHLAPSSSRASAVVPPYFTPKQRQQQQRTLRPGRLPMTVTNVSTNRQMPAASSVGRASPLSRQSSRAGSDRFQSCRSIDDASTSAASYLPPGTPVGAVTKADVTLHSVQRGGNYSGRRHGSPGSHLSSGYPPSTPGSQSNAGGNSQVFYSCRSLSTISEQWNMASPYKGSQPNATPLSARRLPSSSSLSAVQYQSSASLSNLRGLGAALLPPLSPGGSPQLPTYYANTPNAQQEFFYRQASQQSNFERDRPASEAFFSVDGGSSRDVFLDLPSAAETSTVDAFDDDDLELTLGARGKQKCQTARSVKSGTESVEPASPASHYSSVYTAGSSLYPQDPQKAGAGASPASPVSSSAFPAWLAAPNVTPTQLPADRKRRAAAPHIDNVAGVNDIEMSSPSSAATSVSNTSGHKKQKKTAPTKQYYTKADFPPNPHTPSQAMALTAPVAAVVDVVATDAAATNAADAAGPLSPPKRKTGEENASTAVAVGVVTMDSTYVTLSTPSEASTRKSGATRATVKYPGGEDCEIDGDESGDAVRPRALENAVVAVATAIPSPVKERYQKQQQSKQQKPFYTLPTASSTNSFSTVASSYRQDHQQQPRGGGASSPELSQMDAPGELPAPTRPCRRGPAKGLPKRSAKAWPSLQRTKVAAGLRAATATTTPPAVMKNPNPWVPSGAADGAISAHVDPFVLDQNGPPQLHEHSAGATPTLATTPRTPNGGRGRPVRRTVTAMHTAAGKTSIPPRRRTIGGARTAAAATNAKDTANTASSYRHLKPSRLHPVPKEVPRWADLAPTAATTTNAPAQLAVAAKARKSKKAAEEASTHATPPPLQSIPTTTDGFDPQSVNRTMDRSDSVVEYELFTGELADAEGDSAADDTGDVSGPEGRTLAGAYTQQQQMRQLQLQLSNHNPPAFHTSPKPHVEHCRAGFYASPDVSSHLPTSSENSEFMRPFTDAQLAAEMRSEETDLTNRMWLRTTATATTSTKTEDGAAVTKIEMPETRLRKDEDSDEGYDADSGMPTAATTAVTAAAAAAMEMRDESLPQSPLPPCSVSVTSNEDGALTSANAGAGAACVQNTEARENGSSTQVNGARLLDAYAASGKDRASTNVNVVDLSSSSAVLGTAASSGSSFAIR